MLFDPANLTYWIFLTIGVFLFLSVIFLGGGEERDVDADADFEVGAELDSDIEVGAVSDSKIEPDLDTLDTHAEDSEISPLTILSWLGVGKTPLMLLLAIDFSAWGLAGWILNVAIGSATGKIPVGFLGFLVFCASLVFSLWLGRLLSFPIGKMFANFGEDVSGDRLIGCVGTVTSKKIPYLVEGRIGQVDVIDGAGNLITVEVSLPEWATAVPHRGEEILIVERQEHCYLGIAKDSSDADRWLMDGK